jgi:putative transposase
MKKSRFTETQIIGIIKKSDAGIAVKEIRRVHGISHATYYNRTSKYGGLNASDLKRLKEMEQELSHLKSMYADVAMGNRARDLIEKNSKAAGEVRCGELSGGRASSFRFGRAVVVPVYYEQRFTTLRMIERINAINAMTDGHPL